jgi:heavy metal sensor kinase
MALKAKPTLARRITRGLRFRLTVIYVALFAVILTGVGLFFRGVLDSIQNDQVSALLDEEWAALRAYLKIQRQKNGTLKHVWAFDHEDPEAAMIVERLRRVCLIADSNGTVMEASADYASLGVEQPDEIRGLIAANRVSLSIRPDERGTPYMIRSGVIVDEKKPFFVALGKSLAENQAVLKQFTTYYFSLLPVLILGCCLVGWFASKRALSPVTELAEKTDAISGTSLSLRIPLRGAGDEIDHLISTYNNMVERLEQSFNQTRQFSTDVSHELRTPLTVVRGQLEVALMTANTTDQYRDAIVTALQDVERLSNTVRALLHLSQAESGQLTLQRTEFNLSELAADLSEQFQLLADNERVTLETNLPKNCPISADRVQMERLISNLLSNAVKYTPAGGRILLSAHRIGDEVELLVEDTGQGIPADALPHIFDRFYRVPGQHVDPEKGLGLGLSFVAWIVRAHDGTIDVESTQGVGTRFRIRLPASVPETRAELKETYGVGD